MDRQKIYIGNEALVGLQWEMRNLASKNVFIICGKKSYITCGAKNALDRIFNQECIKTAEWNDFQENPKIEDVVRGLELLRASGSGVIIAIGGGSVLDMAKLIRFFYSYEGELTSTNFRQVRELIPLLSLPTTSGTGCEATPFAVCYNGHMKYSVAHVDMLPDYAFVYPPFTYGIPSYLTSCTGFDALAQAIEAYWNVNSTLESDCYAEKAIYMLWDDLPIAVNNPTNEIRDRMAEAAYFAGRAIAITKTTAPHAFSYAFTTHCGYPHGHAVALTFPFFFSLNILEKQERGLHNGIDRVVYANKMQRLINILGLKKCKDCLRYMQDYIFKIHLSSKGFGGQDVKKILSLVNVQRLNNNPVIISELEINELASFLENEKNKRIH